MTLPIAALLGGEKDSGGMVERDTDIPIQRDNAGRVKGCEECV